MNRGPFPLHPDAVLQQALALHQAGRFAEAERGYRQVLAVRPDFAEIWVELGIVQMFQQRYRDAAATIRHGLGFKADYPKGWHHLGDTLAFAGNMAEAADAYRRAIALFPGHPGTHNHLGNALSALGDLDEAAASYRKAISLKHDFPEALVNLGDIYLRQGFPDQALAAARRALAARPGHAESHNLLGNIHMAAEHFEEAQAAFRAALKHRPQYPEALGNLGVVLMRRGHLEESVALLRQGTAMAPGDAFAHNNLGNALKQQGDLRAAEQSYRAAIALRPDFADAHQHLGMVVCEQGRIVEAFEIFTAAARLRYAGTPDKDEGSRHKTSHDVEQQAWLERQGRNGSPFRLEESARVEGAAVNPGNDIRGISGEWRRARPQIVVIDDFLTPEALARLRRFCHGSTVWKTAYRQGYLGALPEHGFAPELLAQIAEELRSIYPAIFGSHPLLHHWAFKYDSTMSGIGIHADFASVNVNFWITPDEANLDPGSGGLVVWDVAAPLDWDFRTYNSDESRIRGFLMEKNAQSVVIPYRANRAVIFDSDLFHETDRLSFRPGYENQRINVTLLYGRREKATS